MQVLKVLHFYYCAEYSTPTLKGNLSCVLHCNKICHVKLCTILYKNVSQFKILQFNWAKYRSHSHYRCHCPVGVLIDDFAMNCLCVHCHHVPLREDHCPAVIVWWLFEDHHLEKTLLKMEKKTSTLTLTLVRDHSCKWKLLSSTFHMLLLLCFII